MGQSTVDAQDPPAPRLATDPQRAAPKKKFPKLKIMVPRRGRTSPTTPTTLALSDPQIGGSPAPKPRTPLAYGVILTPSNEWIEPGMLKQKLACRRQKRKEALGGGRHPASAAAPHLGGPAHPVRAGYGTGTLNALLARPVNSLRGGDDPDTPLHTPSLA